MAGWGNFFGKIADQFAGRIERLKNERVKLIADRDKLMRGDCTIEVASKVSKIDARIKEIENILVNNAKD